RRVRRLLVDPRAEWAHRDPRGSLLQDRRDAGRRIATRACDRAHDAGRAGGSVRHAALSAPACPLQHSRRAARAGPGETTHGEGCVDGPGRLLIVTDTGANIQRMLRILEEVDVGGAGLKVWVEPVHYASATELATKLGEIVGTQSSAPGAAGDAKAAAPAHAS